jgi:uncharacterized protein
VELGLLQGKYVIARFPRDAYPAIKPESVEGLVSISWTDDECTLVAPESAVPAGYVETSDGWAVLRIEGVLDFALVGVLSSVLSPLGHAGVSVFTMSTFNTDYVFVKNDSLDSAIAALRSAGFVVGLP